MLPIALDVNGGDRAPAEIIAGARLTRDECGLPLLLVGTAEALAGIDDFDTVVCTEVIEMDDDAAQGVRRKKDSTLVRAAEAVRDGRASAMVSAGNTGATMASALLRMGRIKGVGRPAIATPIPVPGSPTPTVLLDSGANAECTAEWLVQFAQMGSVYSTTRYGVAIPKVGLLSIGEESSKGTPLVKETHELLRGARGINFIGNVEGRDLMTDLVDVVVTDGFTGNVALKTLEGGLKTVINNVLAAFGSSPEAQKAAEVLLPALLPLYETLHPDSVGGAMLLGTDGVCIISHGSSSARAIVNACRVAAEMVERDLVHHLALAVAPDA
jgi:glycerol-3-phosphate acyltransferase PlsX